MKTRNSHVGQWFILRKIGRWTLSALACCSCLAAIAQEFPEDSLKSLEYRAFYPKTNELVHTKLKVKFDYARSEMSGSASLTLRPHFYATDSLILDAKGMMIRKVEIVKEGEKMPRRLPLKYSYDSVQLKIKLDKKYAGGESYKVYIEYVARPDKLKTKGSAAITDAKGLYFINPKGENKTKPTQIWTQGQTEANSVWVPTIDKPNQKTTSEISMTIPSKYVTLSNGTLISKIKNADGTRTDVWKMDLPHAPYLMFMGVGDFAIVKDSYKGKEVNYYVEKEYEKVARKIFGNTPEMMKYFSEKVTGVEYPWSKYSQIVGTDYVSGAMENTTATLHQQSAQQNERELTDGNRWEDVISHELFHHWFGDLVTAESWSNLTVNESFADYSEFLWREYKFGADEAAEVNNNGMFTYLGNPENATKDLVRYHYQDKEDMFDDVSYPKGGRILNMLRHEVGDKAFFKALNIYLTTNKFGTGNARKLQIAFETVTGTDLNWYFDQWYFGSGHPKVEINYGYNEAKKTSSVIIRQTQEGAKIFKLHLDIDIYFGAEKKRTSVWMKNRIDTFTFKVGSKPDLMNVDGDKIMLWDKTDKKTAAEFIHQYDYAKKFSDRKESVLYFGKHKDSAGYAFLKKALDDPFWGIRIRAIRQMNDTVLSVDIKDKMEMIARKDSRRIVRAAAVDNLSLSKDKKYLPLYVELTRDSSYSVAGAALAAASQLDEKVAIALLPELKKDAKGRLKDAIAAVDVLTKTDADFEDMTNAFVNNEDIEERWRQLSTYIKFLGRINNTTNFKKGVDEVIAFRKKVEMWGVTPRINMWLKDMAATKIQKRATAPDPIEADKQAEYVAKVLK